MIIIIPYSYPFSLNTGIAKVLYYKCTSTTVYSVVNASYKILAIMWDRGIDSDGSLSSVFTIYYARRISSSNFSIPKSTMNLTICICVRRNLV